MAIADIYREEARELQSRAEADLPICIKPEYLRRLRYQMFEDRLRNETDKARSSVTGY